MPRHAPRGAAAPKVGERLDVIIEKSVHRGQGLARHRGQVVFVPGAIPGDRLRVRVVETSAGYVRAQAEELLEPGPGRRAPPCALALRCGGCAYQGVDYATQLRIKEAVLRDTLQRGRAAWDGPIAMHGSPEEGWRVRASLHVQAAPGGLRLGLREAGSHEVVDLDRCLQLSPALNAAARGLASALSALPHWVSRIGDVDLAESTDGGARAVAIEVDAAPREAVALSALADAVPSISGLGVVAGRGPRRTYVHLRGDPFLQAAVLGERLRFHVRSFFQGNRFLVEPLVRHVLELLPAGAPLLDLYAGGGLFAIPLGRRGDEVRGVELSALAVQDAEANVERASLANVRVQRGDVGQALVAWPARDGERVVLDPPRTGAGADVVRAIAARRPRAIVYVSCDPATLARDLGAFAASGYAPDSVTGFDLFPDTFHLETVVRLAPR